MKHLNLWDARNQDSLLRTSSHIAELTCDDSHCPILAAYPQIKPHILSFSSYQNAGVHR